ncbi:glucosamine-6-phosphate deaminase [Peribacillus muralis]|uniref:glucosamine-6-phosphate deaminase n=1 Tax=Peribacillus muralis TaxID=264697 RepID=UPI001F4DB428|nr:glucosamine-6-phosphate deaminase [Peribacillus muralis]MCK1993574.1 glucosamine-6-phosphate deaminase [Peribacillus muralis]MCK2014138.1 glucosamine-6-phosphate deaminase [Peribacillus muralis]
MNNLSKTTLIDQLTVEVYQNRNILGQEAAKAVVLKMKELLSNKNRIRMIFAAAPSQNEFLETLTKAEGIDWSRVTAFHMDEYIGLPASASQRFGRFLKERLFDTVKPGVVHFIDSENSIEEECKRYADLLSEQPIDMVCLGIGENGHIAFNDPPVADFQDPSIIKSVELDLVCRQQQVNDGCFTDLKSVPTQALTLTIPTLVAANYLFCIVPGTNKSEALKHTLSGPITTDCPASILRQHGHCTLYADDDSFELVANG